MQLIRAPRLLLDIEVDDFDVRVDDGRVVAFLGAGIGGIGRRTAGVTGRPAAADGIVLVDPWSLPGQLTVFARSHGLFQLRLVDLGETLLPKRDSRRPRVPSWLGDGGPEGGRCLDRVAAAGHAVPL